MEIKTTRWSGKLKEDTKKYNRQRRRSQQRRGEQSGKGMVVMEGTEWSDLLQENSNNI